jgi:hypothetical protein
MIGSLLEIGLRDMSMGFDLARWDSIKPPLQRWLSQDYRSQRGWIVVGQFKFAWPQFRFDQCIFME